MTEHSPSDDFKRALTAATRSIAKDRELEVKFGGEAARSVEGRIVLPNPPDDISEEKAASLRGKADAAALRAALHDQAAHAKAMPPGARARGIFEAAEQARCEALGARAMKGVGDNLDAALVEKSLREGWNRVEDRQSAPMSEAVSMLVRERISGRPAPEEAKGLMEVWRDDLEAAAGEALDALAEEAGDQDEFARALRRVIRDLDLSDELGEDAEDDSQDDAQDDAGVENQPQSGDEDGDAKPEGGDDEETQDAKGTAADSEDIHFSEDSGTKIEADDEPGDQFQAARPNWVRPEGEDPNAYKVFTTKYDEVITAQDLCDVEELTRLRRNLDHHLKGLEAAVGRLANRMQRRLMAKQQRSWQFDLEEGVLDPARLPRVIMDPMQPLSYKQEKDTEFRDTVVTLLIDNSGSMRGRPILVAAACADILARTLERCGVKCEILGFTTRAWKGGRSKEDWLAAGKPPNPGRLNDLRHIVYKAADAPWRRSRVNLGLMLRDGLLKENIDGEALLWAHQRLLGRPEQRRIMMVISDGAPVDDGTQSANSPAYLEKHLREVIDLIETKSDVELLAIGIGHDVTRYYRRAVTLLDVEQLAGAMTDQLAALFDKDPRRAARGRRRAPSPERSEARARSGRDLSALKRAVTSDLGR
ncbi:cobaltochelatase subunit CobT [Marinicauda salina]|uniref:Cobaltochelatase subunit CobT n=1 Tax=Marinicauda salina TaxID=2135793 RepID=A0A2U2BS65_9PROT|nr:cobaltochelatase subunit CobT [Marinicauda salina]PWE16818.1 cobaltochelatase subunit CobT [Marinicauda salina]